MKPSVWIFVLGLCFSSTAICQDSSREERAKYSQVVTERADKIAATPGLASVHKLETLRTVLSRHFDSLRVVFRTRKDAMEIASKHPDKELANARSEVAWNTANSRLNKLHAAFLGKLSVLLTAHQLEKLKDGMTEGGLQREYNNFIKLFPTLNDIQKAQVRAYLVEARENAMVAEDAEMRVKWFIKYRGRANNFLSAAGYDLRKATEELEGK